jgi:hypothetical protein
MISSPSVQTVGCCRYCKKNELIARHQNIHRCTTTIATAASDFHNLELLATKQTKIQSHRIEARKMRSTTAEALAKGERVQLQRLMEASQISSLQLEGHASIEVAIEVVSSPQSLEPLMPDVMRAVPDVTRKFNTVTTTGQVLQLLAVFGDYKQILSCLLFVELERFVVVLGLSTIESKQDEGLGSFLVDMIKDLLKSKEVFLQVCKDREKLIVFYEKLGFRRMEDEEKAPTYDLKPSSERTIGMVFGLRARRFVFAQFYGFWGVNVNRLKDSELFCPGYVGWEIKKQTKEASKGASKNLSSMQKEDAAKQVAPPAPQVLWLDEKFKPVDSMENCKMISTSSQGISAILLALLCQPGLERNDEHFVLHQCVDPNWNSRPFSDELVKRAFDQSAIGSTMLGTYLGLKTDELREESALTFAPFQLKESQAERSGSNSDLKTVWLQSLKPFADQIALDTLSVFTAKFLDDRTSIQHSDVPKILLQIMQTISKQCNHFQTKDDFMRLIISLWQMFDNPGGNAIDDVAIWDSIEDMVYVTKIMFGSLGFPSLAALGGRRRFYAVNHALLGVLPKCSNNLVSVAIPAQYRLESYFQKNHCLPRILTCTERSVEIVLAKDRTTPSKEYKEYSVSLQGKATRAVPLSLADFLVKFLDSRPALFGGDNISSKEFGEYKRRWWLALAQSEKDSYPFLQCITNLEEICKARSQIATKDLHKNTKIAQFFELFLCARDIEVPGINSPLQSLKQLLLKSDGVLIVLKGKVQLPGDDGRCWCYPNPGCTDPLRGLQWSVKIHEKLLDPVAEHMANMLMQGKRMNFNCNKVYQAFVQGWTVSFLWEVLHSYGAVVVVPPIAEVFPQVQQLLVPKRVDVSEKTAESLVLLSNLHGITTFLTLWLKFDQRFRLHQNFIECAATYVDNSYKVKQADMAHSCPLICQCGSTEESSGAVTLSLMAMLQQIMSELNHNPETSQIISMIEKQLARENVLLLAMTSPESGCSTWTEALEDNMDGRMPKSSARDLILCLATEAAADVNVFTVSNKKKTDAAHMTDRHLSLTNIFHKDFCKNLKINFGQEIVFRQVTFDYVWTTSAEHDFNLTWFRDTLGELNDLLTDPPNGKAGGEVFLPFNVSVMIGLVYALESLTDNYGIHFLTEDQLACCCDLYKGTQAIIKEQMQAILGEEKTTCRLSTQHFNEACYPKEVSKDAVLAVANRIENLQNVRMVCLRRLSKQQKKGNGGGFQGLKNSKKRKRKNKPKNNKSNSSKNSKKKDEDEDDDESDASTEDSDSESSESESNNDSESSESESNNDSESSESESNSDDDDGRLFVRGKVIQVEDKIQIMYAYALGFWNSLVQLAKAKGVWEGLQDGRERFSDVQWVLSHRFDVVPPTDFWIGFDALMPESPAAWVDAISQIYKCPTDELERIRRGFVVSLPGTEVQEWHTDSGEVGNRCAVTALCSLQNLSETMGGTEFSRDPTKNSKIPTGPPVVLKAGEFIVFDYGVWHRAQANRSENVRILYYDLYSKKESNYKDDGNFDTTVSPLFGWTTTVLL